MNVHNVQLTVAIVHNPMMCQLYYQLLASIISTVKGVRLWYSEYLNVNKIIVLSF